MNQLQAVRAVMHHRYSTLAISRRIYDFILGNLIAEKEVIYLL